MEKIWEYFQSGFQYGQCGTYFLKDGKEYTLQVKDLCSQKGMQGSIMRKKACVFYGKGNVIVREVEKKSESYRKLCRVFI